MLSSFKVPSEPKLAGIEYPGPVKSVPRALSALGGLATVSASLNAPIDPPHSRPLHLNLNKSSPFFHPVPTSSVETGNVVVKLVKRRRKRPKLVQGEDGEQWEEQGVYAMKVVGLADRTVRFRAMADFQYTPNLQDPIISLSNSIKAMDVTAIQSFTFPAPDEDFSSLYLPPPVFSRQNVPQPYEYKPAGSSVPITSHRASGEEVQRLTNVSRVKTGAMIAISYTDDVPMGPNDEIIKSGRSDRKKSEEVENRIKKLLEKRPCWTRTGLTNQLDAEDARQVVNNKALISMVSYTFAEGPFRELVIRYGYDPRKDPEARFYQRIQFRNAANVRSKKATAEAKEKGKAKITSSHLSHTFDGQNIYSKIGSFQLIDISDPLAKSLINSTDGVLDECAFSDGKEGWWDSDYFDQIRQIVRRKFTGLLSGIAVTDADCDDLLGDPTELAGVSAARGRKGKSRGVDGGSEESEEASEASENETPKRAAVKKRERKRAPWEGKRRKPGPKVREDDDEEAKAARLRKVLEGKKGRQSERTNAGSGESGVDGQGSEGGTEEEEEEEDLYE
ncbi:hypothetical protein MNV49_004178 [Pseudohyphozyma bogoriensis]|nr:hypothetical protein MNV49_004178 [Pseudohyphozyma bogoriensis]